MIFSLLILVLPIGSYFVAARFVFGVGSETYAGVVAVIVANLVLLGYVVLAMLESENGAGEASKSYIYVDKDDMALEFTKEE